MSEPVFRGNEWTYVKDCLDTGWVSSVGAYVERFEQDVAAYVGAKYAVATVNGTAALHVALLAAGVGVDDEVVVPDLTFVAPANAIRYVGAWPVFVDAESNHWQMDPQKVLDFLDHECVCQKDGLHNRATGRRVRAILPVHVFGDLGGLGRKYFDPILQVKANSIPCHHGLCRSIVPKLNWAGSKVMNQEETGEFVPLCVPEIRGNEWQYIKECLDTNWVSSVGPFVDRFETDFASRIGSRFAVATASGTSALHVALLVAGVEPDDEVLVSTLTFVAPANAVRYVGAWPVFVDAEPDYWQLDPSCPPKILKATYCRETI